MSGQVTRRPSTDSLSALVITGTECARGTGGRGTNKYCTVMKSMMRGSAGHEAVMRFEISKWVFFVKFG